MKIFYEIFRWLGVITGYPAQLLFFKKKVYYENEKAKRRVRGGALVVSNHFNPLDYVLNCFLFFPRKLYVVASEDAFKNDLMRFGMRFWGGIEANRVTGSMLFVSQSIREIRKGHLVQIFPEGHNTPDGKIHPFYPSYLLIALRSDAPIIPVVSDGAYHLFRRTRVIIGEPMDLMQYTHSKKANEENIALLNRVVYEKVLALREELERRKEKERRKPS